MPSQVILSRRDARGNTFACITFMPTPRVHCAETLKSAITRAVTTWMNTTDAGRTTWANSPATFGVSELASEDFSARSQLGQCLIKEDVQLQDIQLFHDDDGGEWDMDDVLVSEADT